MKNKYDGVTLIRVAGNRKIKISVVVDRGLSHDVLYALHWDKNEGITRLYEHEIERWLKSGTFYLYNGIQRLIKRYEEKL